MRRERSERDRTASYYPESRSGNFFLLNDNYFTSDYFSI